LTLFMKQLMLSAAFPHAELHIASRLWWLQEVSTILIWTVEANPFEKTYFYNL
jgi:hypothetical protein